MHPLGSKRPCPSGGDSISFSSSGTVAAATISASMALDGVVEALLALPDPSVALDLALDRVLDSRLLEQEKDRAVDRAMAVGAAILEAARRSARRRAAMHNSFSWSLSSDLTIKVLSLLDTQSLCFVAATCSMFNKCATDSLCYANIDLTSDVPRVNNTVVSTMIQRAGKNLRSLKLGIQTGPAMSAEQPQLMCYCSRSSLDGSGLSWNEKRPRQGKESSGLTRSCLVALTADGGVFGHLLRRLHLYNIDKLDSSALTSALSVCQFLLDLEVVGLHVELRRVMEGISSNCHFLERLFFESFDAGRDDSLSSISCNNLVSGCPNLMSLALRGLKLQDHKIRLLIKGLLYLKFVDLSMSYSITGTFLRNIGNTSTAFALEVLILRDCLHLKEVEVSQFLSALLNLDCKLLKYLDISNKDGLSADNDWNYRCYNPCEQQISRILKERPNLCLVAKFPPEGSFIEIDHNSDSGMSSGTSSQMISDLAFGAFLSQSFENSYSSDQGSGNEDGHDINSAFQDTDSFDELEFPNLNG